MGLAPVPRPTLPLLPGRLVGVGEGLENFIGGQEFQHSLPRRVLQQAADRPEAFRGVAILEHRLKIASADPVIPDPLLPVLSFLTPAPPFERSGATFGEEKVTQMGCQVQGERDFSSPPDDNLPVCGGWTAFNERVAEPARLGARQVDVHEERVAVAPGGDTREFLAELLNEVLNYR